MAHISMSFDDVCETSPRMWKRLNCIMPAVCNRYRYGYGDGDGYTARGLPPAAYCLLWSAVVLRSASPTSWA